jgi:hypothetical protein
MNVFTTMGTLLLFLYCSQFATSITILHNSVMSNLHFKILFNKLTCLDLNLSGNKAALFCIDHFLFHDVLISEYMNKTVEKIPQLIAFHAYVLLLHWKIIHYAALIWWKKVSGNIMLGNLAQNSICGIKWWKLVFFLNEWQ